MSDLNSRVKVMIDAIDPEWIANTKRPFMQWYVDDYRKDTINTLKPEEDSIYSKMLQMQWQDALPVRLDKDYYKRLRTFCGIGFDMRVIKRVVKKLIEEFEFFEEIPDGKGEYWNRRIVKDLYAFYRKSVANSKPKNAADKKSSDNRSGLDCGVAYGLDYGVDYGVEKGKKSTKSTNPKVDKSSTRARSPESHIEESPNSCESQTPTDSDLLPSDKSSGSLSSSPKVEADRLTPDQKKARARELQKAREQAQRDKARQVGPIVARMYVDDLVEKYGVGTRLQKLTSERCQKIFLRLDEWRVAIGKKPSETTIDDYVEFFRQAIDKITHSAFLMGQNDANFKISFDFLCQKSRFMKLMEGGYGNGGVARPVQHRKTAANSAAVRADGDVFDQVFDPATGEMRMVTQ